MNKRPFLAAALLSLLFLGAVFFLAEGTGRNAGASGSAPGNASIGPTKISPAQLRQMLKSRDVFLLDVENVPMDEIRGTDARIAEENFSVSDPRLPQDKAAPVVVYSRTGSYSRIVAYKLWQAGYASVYDLEGGKVAFVNSTSEEIIALQEKVVPASGVALKARWPREIPKLVAAGVINLSKFTEALNRSGKPVTRAQLAVLDGSGGEIRIDSDSGLFALNLLWAVGLANDNPVLDAGAVSASRDRLASTAGWTLGGRPGSELVASVRLVALDPAQQALVERVVSQTYRPCCNNPASFPDCNHGMASLALAEIMASQGFLEDEIFDALLAANAYWFPSSYLQTAAYFEKLGYDWSEVPARRMLGPEYSSGTGALQIAGEVAGRASVAGAGSCRA